MTRTDGGPEGDHTRPVSKAAAAYTSLRRMIVRGELEPGRRVTLKELSELLGMSLTPVREALNRLVSEGYAVHDPHRRTFIAPQSRERVEQVYRLRAVLEPMAVRLAAERFASGAEGRSSAGAERLRALMDRLDAAETPLELAEANERLHWEIYRLCGDGMLLSFIEQLWAGMPYPSQRIYLDDGQGAASRREHALIVDAVVQGRPDDAAREAQAHIEGGRLAALAALEG